MQNYLSSIRMRRRTVRIIILDLQSQLYAKAVRRILAQDIGGDNCCECAWEWVELLEGWSEAEQRQALMDSWEHFVFDTLGILTR